MTPTHSTLLLVCLLTSVRMPQTQGHLWDDLSSDELQEVLDYMYIQSDLALSRPLQSHTELPCLNVSYVRMVEALSPAKTDVVRHLDGGRGTPVRRATAILYRGDRAIPVIEEIVIWPIPSPKNHAVIKNSKWRSPIPFTARSPVNPVELALLSRRMAREFAKIEHILLITTGHQFNNCTRSRCLEIAPAGPPHVTSGKHRYLGYLIRELEGKFLLPVGLQFVLDMERLDPDEWRVLKVWWQGNFFDSFDEMRDQFDAGSLKYKVLHEPNGAFTERLASSLNQRGEPRPETRQRGPRLVNLDGDRIRIDNPREVNWLGWSFNFNIRSTTGIQLHDVSFMKERIIYELSLQEVAVFYSGADPASQHTTFYDADAMLGHAGTELFKGIDCPSDAHFFDAIHYHDGAPLVFRNTICVFEWNRGIPLRRHCESDYNGGYKYYQGIPDNVLIVRTIPTIDNYDYIVDVMFHQDGKIEVKISLTGYLIASFYQDPGTTDKYGYEVLDDIIGNLHLHAANFRVDLDIMGTSNRLTTLDITLEDIPDTLNSGQTLKNRKFTTNLKRTEIQAAYRYDFQTPKYIVFSNANSTNQFGNARGYRLYITDPVKMLWPDDYRGNKAWAWTKYQMAVTLYDEEEQRSSSLYNFEEPFNPIFSLDDYINDDQNIIDKDLVAWVTVGSHHIPHSEDVPIVTTPSLQLSFYLLPYNYFDQDPSLASRDNVRVEPGENGAYIVKHAGVPAEDYCHNADVTCRGVIDSEASSDSSAVRGSFVANSLVLIAVVYLSLYGS